MKRYLALMWALLLLVGCGGAREPAVPAQVPAPLEEDIIPEPEEPEYSTVYIPEGKLDREGTIEAYFEQLYLAYANHTYIDVSGIVETDVMSMRNELVWFETLLQRRRLISEQGYCHVETGRLPYQIRFIDESELQDDRIAFWQEWNTSSETDLAIHFVITGQPGRAYPPVMAVNSQHTMRLYQTEGVWKITFHYYPGSVRRFRRNTPLELPDEEETAQLLLREFAGSAEEVERGDPPVGGDAYNGGRAAWYAARYAEGYNDTFYDIGDWMGNCTNFTSQCVWYGFGGGDVAAMEGMTSSWYAGMGGGSPAWENVDHFWRFATQSGEMGCRELAGVGEMEPGDLMQTNSGIAFSGEEEDNYNHALVLTDQDTLLFAQNSPDCFVYYSDIFGVETRFLRPEYLHGVDG